MYFGRLSSLKTNPYNLFEAMSILKNENKLRLKLHIIGSNNKNDWLEKFPELVENIIFYSYKRHHECLEFATSSDVLLLLATNMNDTEFFPAKAFEYIKLRKPILAIISKRGELSDFLENYGNEYISIEGNTEEIKNNLINLMQKKRDNLLQLSDNMEFIKKFDRKKQTENLVTIFNLLEKDECLYTQQ
jgi:glycosyltransferase involved in cell wall biosynthesis